MLFTVVANTDRKKRQVNLIKLPLQGWYQLSMSRLTRRPLWNVGEYRFLFTDGRPPHKGESWKPPLCNHQAPKALNHTPMGTRCGFPTAAVRQLGYCFHAMTWLTALLGELSLCFRERLQHSCCIRKTHAWIWGYKKGTWIMVFTNAYCFFKSSLLRVVAYWGSRSNPLPFPRELSECKKP